MERFYNSAKNITSSSDGFYTTMIKTVGLISPQKMRAMVLGILAACFMLAGSIDVFAQCQPAISIDFDGATDESCQGANDGTITVGAFSGIPPYVINLYSGATATGAPISTTIGDNSTVFTGLSGGTYSVEVTNFDPNAGVGPIEVTLDFASTIGFMNVFELPANGGGYVFGSGWGVGDLVAFDNGDGSFSTAPNQIDDPDPFWYQGGGGPGAPGNKTMEANLYNESGSAAFAGQTLEASIEVTGNSSSCGHESFLFISELDPANGFATVNTTVVPLAGAGVYMASMNISASTTNIVQWGIRTVGPNVWSTDAAACGTVDMLPVVSANTVCSDVVEGIVVNTAATFPAFVVLGVDENGLVADDIFPGCDNNCDGAVSIVAGPPTAGLEYSMDGGPFGPSNIFIGLCGGAHTSTIRFADNPTCTTTVSFDLEPLTATAPTVTGVETCAGTTTGTLSATACDEGCEVNWYSDEIGGTLVGNGEDFDPIASGAVNGNISGTYTFYAECACNPCLSDRVAGMFTINPTPDAPIITGPLSVCPGDAATFTVENADPTSTYEWFVAGVSQGTGAQIDITLEDDGEVTVTVTDANTCEASASTSIAVENDQTMACKPDVVVALDTDCSADLPTGVFIKNPPYDMSSYAISSIVDEENNPLQANMDGSYTVTGKGVYTVSVEHLCSGNRCWSNLITEDNTAPVITCAPTQEVFCDGDLAPRAEDFPTATDNCCPADEITYEIVDESDEIPAGTVMTGFRGMFGAGSWATEKTNGGIGSISFSDDGTTLDVIGDAVTDVTGGAQTVTSAVFDFEAAGTISLSYSFSSTAFAGTEAGQVVTSLDGVLTGQTAGILNGQSGTITDLEVTAGTSLLLNTISVVGQTGGTFTITDFSFTTAEDFTSDATDACGGMFLRTWVATDCCGNVSEPCSQLVVRIRPGVVDFPADVNLECDNDNSPSTDPVDTGYPTIEINGVDVAVDGKVCTYIASYTDTPIPAPCADKIIRQWTVFDWCAGEVFDIQDQFITVTDNAAPVIECPEDANVASNAYECEGTYTIPDPAVTDGCSSTSLVITTGDGTVVSPGMVIDIFGSETITYVASDACGNVSTTCTQMITVFDGTAPVAICDQNTVVSIGTDGLGLVCATTVDDGSYDNCSDNLDISVKRMDAPNNVPFTPCVEFDCTDVGETIIVRFRVSDGTGFGECMVNVEVQDKIGPAITCPPNKDLNCNADFYPNEVDSSVPQNQWNATYNGELIGFYPFLDNCGPVNITITDSGSLDFCGEGTILRTWTASDNGGSASCVQTISIFKTAIATFTGDDVPGDDDDINWPIDVDLDCTDFQNDSSITDPTNAGEPELIGEEDDCASLFIGYEDQFLFNDPTACYKILRTWKVIDHCQFDPANGIDDEGIWIHTQLIKVNDQTDPVFDNCDDEIVSVDGENGCFGEITITKTASDACDMELDYSWTILAEDGFTYNGVGSTITGTYDVGTHTVTWTATDNCGNEATCTHLLKVSDAKKPTPVCVVLYTAVMPTTGSVEIWATDFESGSSFDNCTAHEDLNHYILPADAALPASDDTDISDLPTNITFTCDQLGYQNVHVFVEDESGSWDYCLTQVWINDSQCACPNNPDCNGGAMPMIQGHVTTEMNDMVEDVAISISGNAATTGADGLFGVLNLPPNNDYVVTPSKDINWANGVTTYDLVLISQHILGVQSLDSPYKMIAADANMSNTITTLDLVKIQRLILGLDADLAPNTSWRFVDLDFVFPDNSNPFATTFPEVISYDNLTTSEMYTDFIGVKIGDVNDSAIPNALLGSALRNTNGALEFEMEDRALKAEQTYEVAITANNFKNVLGFQYTINVDNAEILDVIPGKITTAENFGMSDIANGNITTSWFNAASTSLNNDEVVYTIKLKANQNTRLSNVLTVSSSITRAEAYNNNADLLDVAFTFTNSTTTTTAFELYQNRPNPFKANTAIGFNLPEAHTVTLTIMDVSGKVLRQLTNDFAKGYNEFTLNNNIEGSGVFYYRIETATDTATKKMIILE